MTLKHVSGMLATSAALRRAVERWRSDLTPSDTQAIKALNEVRQEAADGLEQKANQWLSENKLIHAGAARKLAAELRRKVK